MLIPIPSLETWMIRATLLYDRVRDQNKDLAVVLIAKQLVDVYGEGADHALINAKEQC